VRSKAAFSWWRDAAEDEEDDAEEEATRRDDELRRSQGAEDADDAEKGDRDKEWLVYFLYRFNL